MVRSRATVCRWVALYVVIAAGSGGPMAAQTAEQTDAATHPEATTLLRCRAYHLDGQQEAVFLCRPAGNNLAVRFVPASTAVHKNESNASTSVTWPSGGAGIPNYNGSSAWGTSYSASNLIPSSFLDLASPGAIGTTTPAAGVFSSLVNNGAEGPGGEFMGIGAGGSSSAPGLNTGVGEYALGSMNSSSAAQNVAVGHVAGYYISSGGQNVAIGESAQLNVGSGSANVAVGWAAQGGCDAQPCMNGTFPVAGENTAVGWESQYLLTTGSQNTAVGENSMSHLTTGNYNTTVGADSQSENTTGSYNTTYGHDSMTGSVPAAGSAASCAAGPFVGYTASQNTAIGEGAYCTSTTGQDNTVVGWQAGVGLMSGSGNTYIGTYAGTIAMVSSTSGAGNNNTFVGMYSGTGPGQSNTNYSNSTALGYEATVTASNQIVLGNSSVTEIVVPSGVAISGAESGSPAITFGPTSVNITQGAVSGSPSSIVARVPSATFEAKTTQPLTEFYTTAAAGQYQLCAQLSVKSAGSGSGTFSTAMQYTSDGSVNQTDLGGAVAVETVGASNIAVSARNVPNCVTVYLDSGTAVSWEIVAAGTISAEPTMRYSFTILYLGS